MHPTLPICVPEASIFRPAVLHLPSPCLNPVAHHTNCLSLKLAVRRLLFRTTHAPHPHAPLSPAAVPSPTPHFPPPTILQSGRLHSSWSQHASWMSCAAG